MSIETNKICINKHLGGALKRNFVLIALAYLTTLSVNLLESVPDCTLLLKQDVKQIDIYIALIALSFFYIRFYDFVVERKHWVTVVLSAVFSLCTMLGVSFAAYDNWNFVVAKGTQGVNTIFTFLGVFVLTVYAMTFIFYGMTVLYEKNETVQSTLSNIALATGVAPSLSTSPDAQPDTASYDTVAAMQPREGSHTCKFLRNFLTWIDGHFSAFTLLAFTICWLSIWMIFLPGSIWYDSLNQINQAFGIFEITNHHPWPITYLYGGIMKLAYLVGGNDNFALFCLTAFNFCLSFFSLCYVCLKLKKYGGLAWGVGATMFFCFVPVFISYAQQVMKDTIYMALFALFSVWYLEFCIGLKNAWGKKPMICLALRLVLVALCLCISRNNGIYVVVPMFLALIFLYGKKAVKYALILALATYLCYTGVENFGRNVLEIPDGSIAEALSIPFQQTARYLLYYPDDVTEEEQAAIAAVLNYDTIADRYTPEISDKVKATYKEDKQALKAYFKAWFTMFLRHPGVYIQATINNTYRYYCMFQPKLDDMYNRFFIFRGEPVYTGDFDFYYIGPEKLRTVVINYVVKWRNLPIIEPLTCSAFYTWLMLLCAGWLIIQKRKRLLWFLLGAALSILVCIAGPQNGSIRYMLPVFASAPVWVFSTFMKEER